MSTTPSARELPADEIAEKSLLSCLIIDHASFDEISHLYLKSEDFYFPKHSMVFDAIYDLKMSNAPVDYVTLSNRLQDLGKLEIIGGRSFLVDLTDHQASSANIYHYAKIVKEKSVVRNVVLEATRVADMGRHLKGGVQEFLQQVESRFFRLTVEGKSQTMQKLNVCLKQNLIDLENDQRKPGEISGLPTGFKKLDEKLLGLQPGQLVILAARPAMGKTALALNLALNSCKMTGLPVAIFSLEMLSGELSLRLLCSEAKVDSKRIKTKNFLDTDLRNIGAAVGRLSQMPVFINDSGGTTTMDVASQCRKIKAEQGLGLIVIDYIQLMRPIHPNIPREQQISEISRALKNMAKELEVPVLALSQLNRSVETRTEKRPMVSDLRESGSIEQDADIVLLLYRDDAYNPDSREKGVAEVIIGKNRSGEVGVAKLSFVGAYTLFADLAYAETDQNEHTTNY